MGGARGVWIGLLAAAMVVAVGCSSGGDDGAPKNDAPAKPGADPNAPAAAADADQLRERPWEVVSNKGETYLANVFYSDTAMNEQIIPWSLGKPQIDRLVYPTLGNPNLFVKDDASEELTMVLRIEPDAYDHLIPSVKPGDKDAPGEVSFAKNDDTNGFAFFLVARSARTTSAEANTAQSPSSNVFRIKPKAVLQNAEPSDMPDVLKKRHTLRFVFDQAAISQVPAGLYDARFEVRKNGQVYANVFEFQYNAVRVYDTAPEEYTALNVTDTQVSIGPAYQTITADKLDDFVTGVNNTADPVVKAASFITFNGDLHNGGSPETIRTRSVALTYQQESKRIVGALKQLDFPIFLTAGNHDGYVGLGHVPGPVKSLDSLSGDTLEKIVKEQNNMPWPDFSWDAYNDWLTKTAATPDGKHLDLFTGRFTRKPGLTFKDSFIEVPSADRNYILYDGFHQWQKSYGPLYASWTFGKNRYVSINSFELRQHRRTGWGMYTVNYGGGISTTQMDWIDREIARGNKASEDIVMLMHHDPRGGHKGKDFGYYFPLVEYKSIAQSTLNYLLSDKLTPLVCSKDDLSLSVDERDSCLHDGLEEWHAPDADFDKKDAGFWFSATEILTRIAKNPNVRTVILGHTHYNSLEVIQKGEVLVPGKVSLTDTGAVQRIASAEAANPVRRFAWEAKLLPELATVEDEGLDSNWGPQGSTKPLTLDSFNFWRDELDVMLAQATTPEMRVLSNTADTGPRELAVLRLTSAANLTGQSYNAQPMYGYSVLHITKATGTARVNRVTYFINTKDVFNKVATVDVDRTKSLASRAAENPLDQLFKW